MKCPNCHEKGRTIKKGFYCRVADKKRVQRYECCICHKCFSEQTYRYDYRLRKRRINQLVFRLLAKGNSQRGCAQILEVDAQTIGRRLERFGEVSKKELELTRKMITANHVLFDEMESFEHTKLKPLTLPIAVEHKTRKILSLEVGQIAAKGPLAVPSRQKYGRRSCQRKKVITKVLSELESCLSSNATISTDESQHYRVPIRKQFPSILHKAYKGKRGAVIGQGEMKKIGYDPLFYLNHTYAMIRDNIKRLARKTWCTTKKVCNLKNILYLYSNYHNQIMSGIKRPTIKNVLGAIRATSFKGAMVGI